MTFSGRTFGPPTKAICPNLTGPSIGLCAAQPASDNTTAERNSLFTCDRSSATGSGDYPTFRDRYGYALETIILRHLVARCDPSDYRTAGAAENCAVVRRDFAHKARSTFGVTFARYDVVARAVSGTGAYRERHHQQ